MSITHRSKIQFTPKQIEILEEIVSKQAGRNKMEYKKITEEFNEVSRMVIPAFKTRSKKAIQFKVKSICKIEKHFWNFSLDQIMLEKVTDNWKWKQIAQMPVFRQHGLISRDIKRRFQCGVRNKFLNLFREIYPNQQPPRISDLLYKCLLQEQAIVKYFQEGHIFSSQKQCLISNIRLFATSLYDEDERLQIRSSKIKNRVLRLVSSPQHLKMLVDSIIKLHDLKKKKQLKIDQILLENDVTHPSKSKHATPDLFSSLSQQFEAEVEVRQIDQQIEFEDYEDDIEFQVDGMLEYLNEDCFLKQAEDY